MPCWRSEVPFTYSNRIPGTRFINATIELMNPALLSADYSVLATLRVRSRRTCSGARPHR